MAESIIGTYFYPDQMKTYYTVEGDITIHEGLSCETGKRGQYAVFENEIRPETFVTFTDELGEDGLAAVKAVEAGEYATHYNMYEPEWDAGFRPTEDMADGEYPRRAVACGQFKSGMEIPLPLSATNAEIKPNDRLSLVDAHFLDKSSKDTCVIALEAKAANEGGLIFVHLTEAHVPVASP